MVVHSAIGRRIGQHLSGSSTRMWSFASIDEGSCVGRIVQHLAQSRLSWFAPDKLTGRWSSTLLSRHQNAIITQAAHYLLATAQGGKTGKDQFDGALHLQIGRFAHPSILQADQPCRYMLRVSSLLNLAASPSVHA